MLYLPYKVTKLNLKKLIFVIKITILSLYFYVLF
nr:MAG TPA_asm: hypothetical protein [Caudoviricetes sp.]